MAIDDLILREVSYPPLTTKGSALTFDDLDGNFINVYDAITDMNSGGAIAPFNILTTYPVAAVVAYSGKIYINISGSATTGDIPSSSPAIWGITNIGAVAHVQNTDTKLAEGTANEVSAADLKSLVDEQIIDVTIAEWLALVAGDFLITNRLYRITDAISFGNILVLSLGGNKYSKNGYCEIKQPDVYQTLGVWNFAGTYAIADCVMWDGRVYENTTGTNNSALSPDADSTNWVVLAYTSGKYFTKLYEAQLFSYTTGIISKLKEGYSENEVAGYNDLLLAQPKIPVYFAHFRNTCDLASSIGDIYRINGDVVGNICSNTTIGVQSYNGDLLSNTFHNAALYIDAESEGEINGNCFRNVQINWLLAAGDKLRSSSIEFSDYETTIRQINMRSGSGDLSNIIVNENGSNAIDTIDTTGNNILNLDINGSHDLYGKYILTSTNATETIDRIVATNYLFPIIVQPESGLTLTLTMVNPTTASAGDICGNAGTNIVLDGTKGDYVKAKQITFGAVDIWQIIEIVKN